MLRKAREADVPQMIALAAMKRTEYESFAPTFWHQAKDAAEKQTAFFCDLLHRENTLCLVSEHEEQINGFIIAAIVAAPPVYDPGSLVCIVDDFVMASPVLWTTVGKDLLQEARRTAESQGAKLAVVVCGHRDEPKREMLQSAGLSIASEWYVSP